MFLSFLTGLNALTYVMDNVHHGKEVQQKVLDLVDQGPQKDLTISRFSCSNVRFITADLWFSTLSLFFQFVQMGRTGDIIRARTYICLPADVWCAPTVFILNKDTSIVSTALTMVLESRR